MSDSVDNPLAGVRVTREGNRRCREGRSAPIQGLHRIGAHVWVRSEELDQRLSASVHECARWLVGAHASQTCGRYFSLITSRTKRREPLDYKVWTLALWIGEQFEQSGASLRRVDQNS